MKRVLVLVLSLFCFLAVIPAEAYNPVSSKVVTRADDPETRDIYFQVRNNSLLPMVGYYYEIRLFDREGRRVLTPFGEVFQGYQDLSLPAGESGQGRVTLSQISSRVVRAQVILTLVCTMRGGESHYL